MNPLVHAIEGAIGFALLWKIIIPMAFFSKRKPDIEEILTVLSDHPKTALEIIADIELNRKPRWYEERIDPRYIDELLSRFAYDTAWRVLVLDGDYHYSPKKYQINTAQRWGALPESRLTEGQKDSYIGRSG